MSELAARRVSEGLCPQCGKEAAPFYLCFDCRQAGRIRTAGKRLQKHGVVSISKKGRNNFYMHVPGAKSDDDRWSTPWIPPEDDGRFKPRVQKIRVDVEKTLISIMEHLGRPVTEQELYAAWGKLRAKRSSPLPSDLARIIAAEDKRNRKRRA